MRVVIVEDEQLAAEKLMKLLHAVQSEVTVLAVLESVEDAINWFATNPPPDLVFLDIQLDDGISFEIFDAVGITAPIIFTTAFDEYAIRAFKVNSVDYLLKPIAEQALTDALEKFKRLFGQADLEGKITKVMEQFSKKYKSRFFVKVGARYQSIPVSGICCFFVEERNTFMRTTGGKIFDVDYSLDRLQTITDPEMFFRVNRNFIVNIHCIKEIVSYSTSRLKLKLNIDSGDDIVVSRDKVTAFKQWMDK